VGQISAGLANAHAYESERQRAEQLSELDRAKTAFFSNVSHEFRTPLTLILGPLSDLLQGRYGELSPEQRNELIVLERNGLRLLKLVNTLLDFSRIEAGRTQARFEATDLAELTTDLASAFRSAIERVGMQLIVKCELPAPVYVDRSMWEKVVLNLLSNAFKFTFEGSISVTLTARNDHAVLTVSDTGTGIPAAELPQLFDRFHRIEGARGRTHEGSGIGLALVQELVKLHGGQIEAQSELGRGTTFSIELPFGSAHLPAERIARAPTSTVSGTTAAAFVQEALRWLPEGVTEDATVPAEVVTGPRARLVLADDNADMREYVSRLLSTRYEVDAHPNGARALEAIRQNRPALVLTDVMMPELDGFGLLQSIRADPALQELPVIMLSARSGDESRSEGLEAGADDYVVKPFSARELLARVGTHLEMAKIRAAAAEREHALLTETRAAKEQLERILSSVNDAFVTLDANLRFTYVNARAATFAGVSQQELHGLALDEWGPALADPSELEHLREALRTGKTRIYETRFEPTRRWLEVRVYPYADGLSVFVSDITARKEAEDAMRAALLSEREAVRYRDEFLGVASHELRTPLASLKMQLELTQLAAKREGGLAKVPSVRIEKLVGVLDRQVSNLDRLVKDLLDVSRVANGRLTVETEEVDLVALVRAVIDQFAELLAAAGCTVRFHGPDSLLGYWDPRRVEQVVSNLLTNAMKYAPGKPVDVIVTGAEARVSVRVRDYGDGIAPEHQQRIFERFERVTQRSGVSGLGLGLFVAKEIVQAHGGDLRVESKPGDGATFIVELPRSAAVR
jgi:PAS domain S-box-containing protein